MAMHKDYKDLILGATLPTNVNSSPLRRKSLHVQNAVLPVLSENNDEAERLARRREIDVLSSLAEHTNNIKRRSLGLGFLAQMSAPEIKDRISECIKLNTENKINIKNAFSLQMIDLMTYMIKKQDANMSNLQVASTSLDVSTKIYGFRVDGVYTEIMKMAGGLDKQEDGNPNHGAKEYESGEQQNEMDDLQKQSKLKRKRNRQKIFGTIDSLKGPIEVRKPSLWTMENEDSQSMDTLHQVTQLNNANSRFYLQLYGGIIVDSVEHTPVCNTGTVDIPKIENFFNLEICPPLANFEFQDWSSDDEETNVTALPEEQNENKFQFDLDASLPSDNESEAADSNINYLDISDGENAEKHTEMKNPMEKIVDLCKVISVANANKTSEYSFLQKSTNVHWAGPTHWRIGNYLNHLGQSKIVGTCHQEPGRKRKEIELNYNDKEMESVLTKYVKSKATKVNSSKLDWHEEFVTLPRDMHYDTASIYKMYNHRLIFVYPESKDVLNETRLSDVVEDYDYHNENDTSNYCPNVPNEDYEIDEENNENECNLESENTGTVASTIFAGDNLVAAPKLTNKISIAYSTRAKRIDMRQLKKSIWNSLILDNDWENIDSQNIVHQKEKDKLEEMKCFSEIYKALPKMLTKTNVEALSFPISFVSLLHLANEKTLSVQSLSDMSDLTIKAD